jgi:hypothetical protein
VALADLHGCHLMAKALQSYGLWKAVTDLREVSVSFAACEAEVFCSVRGLIVGCGAYSSLKRRLLQLHPSAKSRCAATLRLYTASVKRRRCGMPAPCPRCPRTSPKQVEVDIPGQGTIVGINQGWKLSGAIKTAERKLSDRSLIRGGQALMAWVVGNARVEPKGNPITITKQASGTAKIDPLMAAFNAVAWMSANPASTQPSIFVI